MRNLQRLEKLSSATALGLWAEGVILSLDRVTRLGSREADDVGRLKEAAEIVDAARDMSAHPVEASVGTGGLTASAGAALDVAESLIEGGSPERAQAKLAEVAEGLRKAAEGRPDEEKVDAAIGFFSAIGRQQLAEGNAVSGFSGGNRNWTAAPTTWSFSRRAFAPR